jgi:hypothetical protein
VLDYFLLAAVPTDATDADAGYACLEQRLLDRSESLGADDAAYEFHGSS